MKCIANKMHFLEGKYVFIVTFNPCPWNLLGFVISSVNLQISCKTNTQFLNKIMKDFSKACGYISHHRKAKRQQEIKRLGNILPSLRTEKKHIPES